MISKIPIFLSSLALGACPPIKKSSSGQADPQAKSTSVAAGDHFKVICHFQNEAVAKEALKTAEAVWPLAKEVFTPKSQEKKVCKPLEIHLYRNRQDYQEVEAEITGGAFKENLSFSSYQSKSSHIALEPKVISDKGVEVVAKTPLLLGLHQHMIAHEASHLVCYELWQNYASHPDWFAEGYSTWLGAQSMIQRGLSAGYEEDPYLANSVAVAQSAQKRGFGPILEKILRGQTNEFSLETRYGLYQLLFRFLNEGEHQARFPKLIGEARRLGGGQNYSDRLYQAFNEIYGQDGSLEKMEGEFQKFIGNCKPRWRQFFRSLDTHQQPWVQQAFNDKNAIAWRVEPIGAETYQLQGALTIFPGAREQCNLLLDRNEKGFITIAFSAGFGITVFDYQAQENRWQRLAQTKVPALVLNKTIPFKVHVEQGTLDVQVQGQTVLKDVVLPERKMAGPWGLGVQAGGKGTWHNVSVKIP